MNFVSVIQLADVIITILSKSPLNACLVIFYDNEINIMLYNFDIKQHHAYTVDSRYLEVEGTF